MRHATPLAVAAALTIAGAVPAPAAERWYTPQQVARGGPLYQQHCASCHRPDASGTPDWRKPGPDGKYPPPPLDGSAHTWHHPLFILQRTIKQGGERLGGVMPGFADRLSDRDVDAILAWVQSRWSDEIYERWVEISRRSSKSITPTN